MSSSVNELLDLLTLERLEVNIFRGQSRDIGSAQVFGGQVLGQALSAAQQTVTGRDAHSMHAYFLRRGDIDAPIVYEVDHQRDGRSFSVRRVVAIQHGRPIFNMAASFQVPEAGLEHQSDMPNVPPPDALLSSLEISERVSAVIPEKMRRFLRMQEPLEFRPVHPEHYLSNKALAPAKQTWMRVRGELPDDDNLHRSLLAYLSDYELLGTATLPHGLPFAQGKVQMASLDHALWFHRQMRVDRWLLCDFDSPNTSGARGLARSRIFDADGVLVASSAQEGLIRLWDEARTGGSTDFTQQR
ncbi:MAG: acyl-CoA thioesterase II [Pseudomonadota bacterium]